RPVRAGSGGRRGHRGPADRSRLLARGAAAARARGAGGRHHLPGRPRRGRPGNRLTSRPSRTQILIRCPVASVTRPLRIALLSYRSKPHSGGQGVYVRHLSRELAARGHHVEVLSGQPYPELDPGPALRELPSLDLYRDDDPFHTPRPGELRDWADALEVAMMW